jgi:hypothetical protein
MRREQREACSRRTEAADADQHWSVGFAGTRFPREALYIKTREPRTAAPS